MENKHKKYKWIMAVVVVLDLFLLWVVFAQIFPHQISGNFALLNPKGIIAAKEKSLLITATLLMMVVVVPVFCTAIFIVWKYRAGRINSPHEPNLEKNTFLSLVFWLISGSLIFAIGLLIWKSSHELDVYKTLESSNKPLTIQVVALNWKWLFIYPDQNIATVNFIEVPKNTPINFELTADAPMNTFWIPQLGGQVYAMAGMQNQLHLMASDVGTYEGSATEINGKGYAGMRFKVMAVEQGDFDLWVKSVRDLSTPLNMERYNQLVKDSENNPAAFYSLVEPKLFDTIIRQFMVPGNPKHNDSQTNQQINMEGMK